MGIERKDGTEKRNFLFYSTTAHAQSPAFKTDTSFFLNRFSRFTSKKLK